MGDVLGRTSNHAKDPLVRPPTTKVFRGKAGDEGRFQEGCRLA